MEAPFFMSPRLTQMPSFGKQFKKHMLTMQGTSESGGRADPATQQHIWLCTLQHVVGATQRRAQHPQHKNGVPVLQQMSASTAQESLLRSAADVVAFGDAAVVATAASMVHDHLSLVDGIHLNLPWGGHV
eukprot:CAMPEP_0181477798 /NCGR_PEP_ID=MMETSP1110-20121109/42406_1 /TAXON_ID=174948 /ORGANISM="Symbiodinium sp., Strain CCMP421" /LENGTH=129 /DNA_ID=CAMNT_0023603119 /DNA_START=170 /DNA_END=558 /DNA_ORIENTATION=-